MLEVHIEARRIERQGKASTNFELTSPKPDSDLARESLKDPYRLNFLGLGNTGGSLPGASLGAHPHNLRLHFQIEPGDPYFVNSPAYTGVMSMNLAEVEQAMFALDRRDLAALIHRGIQLLDHGDSEASQDEVDEAWRDELSNRIDDIESGRVETVPAEDVFARVRANIAARRQ